MYIPSSSNLIRVQSYQQTVNCERALHKIDVVLLIKIMGNSLKKKCVGMLATLKKKMFYIMHFWTLQDHIHTSLFKEKERNFKKNKIK